MEIKRDFYLEQLKIRKDNGMIKIITESEDAENLSCYLCYIRNIYWKVEWIVTTSLR